MAIGLQPNQELPAENSQTLNPGTIRSDPDEIKTRVYSQPDDTVTRVKHASMHRGVSDTDDIPVTNFPNRIGLQDWTALPASPELDDDDVIGWRLVPFFGLVLVFLVTKTFSRQGDTSRVPAGYDEATSKSRASANPPQQWSSKEISQSD
jgi:hypothetical protein